MATAVSTGARLRGMWDRQRRLPGGGWIFSRLLRWVVPYSATIAPRVVELRPGYARVSMRDRRGVRNHLTSIHAMALANLGELTTGLALNVGLPDDARAILKGIRVEYLKKSRGTITAESACEVPVTAEETEHEIVGELRDEAGDVVARATATWLVGPRRRS
ncbi:MAG: hotdog fold domain-containing protein [Acidobacteriota bacterium]|nr:hotdog fold domain-containing protein [Acidobacteriota bacterium]